jgi:hypothetical protein
LPAWWTSTWRSRTQYSQFHQLYDLVLSDTANAMLRCLVTAKHKF